MREKAAAQSVTREGTPEHMGHRQPKRMATLTPPQAFDLAQCLQNSLERLWKPHPTPPAGAFQKNGSTVCANLNTNITGAQRLLCSPPGLTALVMRKRSNCSSLMQRLPPLPCQGPPVP